VGSKKREKRAAKQKARDHRRGFGGRSDGGVHDDDLDAAEWAFAGPRWSPELVSDIVLGLIHPDAPEVEDQWRALLADPPPADADNVRRGLEIALFRRIEQYWRNGWLPVDLVEHLRRSVPAAEQELAGDAIAAQLHRYARASLHPRWWASMLEADVGPDRRPTGPSTTAWAIRHGEKTAGLLEAVQMVLTALETVRALPTIVPPPESAGARRAAHEAAAGAGIDPKVLARVRALLAKAESTPYPEEAEALSGKAQELMNRHALEQALVEGAESQEQAVITVRMWLEAPYVQPKTLLVQSVAEANRCRSVASTGTDMVSIVGHAGDLEVVQVLTTSLLVQAGRAMIVTGRSEGSGGRSRSRSFRQTFLVAYATRIGERLRESSETAADQVSDERLLPVLARRASAVEDAVGELFGELNSKTISASDGAGWHAGRAAADAASLTLDREGIPDARRSRTDLSRTS
jgi:hypothetical protein